MSILKSKELIVNILKNDQSTLEVKGELLEKLHSIELEMLIDIQNVCNKNDINIFLGGGTLLGAIRHGGFIPWDDDIDLNIHRKDVIKFQELIKTELANKYTVFFGENQVCPFIRVEKNGSIFDEPINITRDRGIKIDIFIMEDLPTNILIRFIYGIICTAKLYIASSQVFYENKDERFVKIMKNVKKSRINYYIRYAIGKIFSYKTYYERIKDNDKYFSKYLGSNSYYVSFMNGRKHYFGEMYPREMFQNIIEVNFEGIKCKAQKDYDSYLKKLYGKNYMDIPPEDKREHHRVFRIEF